MVQNHPFLLSFMKTNFKLFLILLVFPVLLPAQNTYPEWFLFPGKYSDIVTGYARRGGSTVSDAETTWCAFKSCVAMGTLYRYQDMDQVHSDYYYNYSPDELKKIKGNLHPVKGSFTALNMITQDFIEAFSTNPDLKVSIKKIHVKTINRPGWLNKYPFYAENGYYYGIGEYTSRYNKIDAWKKAEDLAIFNIMTGLAVQYHTVMIETQNNRQDTMEKVQAQKVKYLLRNIRVMERWMDIEKDMVYVLIQIPKNDVISPLLNK